MRSSTISASLVLLAGAWGATPTLAQTGNVVMREGDHVLSLGNVRAVFNVAVNDNGVWFTEVSTDNGDNNRDFGILRDSFLTIREGTFLPAPVGATIKSFTSLSVNAQGHLGWPLSMRDTAGGNNDDEGLFWNTLMLAQEGGPVNAAGVSVNTNHRRFSAAKINDLNSLLLVCDIDDPDVPGTLEDALILYRTDGAGSVTSSAVLYTETDQVNFGETVRSIGSNASAIALNNNDDWLCQIQLTGPTTTNDTAIMLNGQTVIREGGPSFQEGRTWNDLANTELDMNDRRDYVLSMQLNVTGPTDGLDNSVIVVNGEAFVQEGNTFPSIAPYSIVNFVSAPVYIGNSGDVFWYGTTNNPDSNANGIYFRNRDVIIQQGQLIGPDIVVTMRTNAEAFHASPSGRFWIGEVGLQSVGDSLILADFGLVVEIPGCSNNPGTVSKAAGSAVTGSSVTFAMDDAQGVGATPFLYFSTQQSIPGAQCGINTSFGELLIGIGSSRIIGKLFGPPWNGAGPSLVNLNIPADPTLVDRELFAQGLFWDMAGTSGAERFRLTNALRIEIGAP